jgi:hypothetical protein
LFDLAIQNLARKKELSNKDAAFEIDPWWKIEEIRLFVQIINKIIKKLLNNRTSHQIVLGFTISYVNYMIPIL